MSKKRQNMIGHDPLAWIEQDKSDDRSDELRKENDSQNRPKQNLQADKTVTVGNSEPDVVTKDNNELPAIKLDEVSDITKVSSLHKQWSEYFSGPAIIIDASAVDRIDTAALQLIYAIYKEAKSKNIEFKIDSATSAMEEGIALLGMDEALKLH